MKLAPVHTYIAVRRLNFASRVVGEGECKIARSLFFAEIPKGKRCSGRMQADFRKRLIVDLKNLDLSDPTPFGSFQKLAEMQAEGKVTEIRRVLKSSQKTRGSGDPRATLQNSREMLFACKRDGCSFEAAEMKEVNRHDRKVHPAHGETDVANLSVGSPRVTEPPSLGDRGFYLHTTQGPPFQCGYLGCSMTYKLKGTYFKKHVMKNHGKILIFSQKESYPEHLSLEEGAVPTETALLGGPGITMPQLGIVTPGLDETAPAELVTYPSESCAAMRGLVCTDQRQSTLDKGLAGDGIWSETNVPSKCPFFNCLYPFDGRAKSWKSWRNHCAEVHSWNLAGHKPSRKRAGKLGSTSKALDGSSVQTVRPCPGPLESVRGLNAPTLECSSKPVVAVLATDRDTRGGQSNITPPGRNMRVLRQRVPTQVLRQSPTLRRKIP